MSYDEIKRLALKLPADEQRELGHELIRNAGGDEDEESEIERLWVEEAERRLQDHLDGKIEAVPGEEAIRRIRASIQ
jgi:hypothetical protein